MARLPRLAVAGHPHHIIQRGNNRQIIFQDDADRRFFLELLADIATRNRVALHAYVLMDNHFHLLMTPSSAQGLPVTMQAVGRRYVQYFNRRHQRSGTLWEGRYRATPIQSERYLLACMSYIDLNPVRAGLAAHAADFGWSSYAHYAGLRVDRLISPHALYWQLGNTPFAREAAYTELVRTGLGARELAQFTDTAFKGWALGDEQFLTELQKQTPRRLARGRAGRPFSAKKSEDNK